MAYRKNETTTDKEITSEAVRARLKEAPPVITVDYERYEHMLENSEASEEQKREFVETIWNIVMMFVDMGFGVHPVQQAQEACGKHEEKSPKAALVASGSVKYSHGKLTKGFNGASDDKDGCAAGGAQ